MHANSSGIDPMTICVVVVDDDVHLTISILTFACAFFSFRFVSFTDTHPDTAHSNQEGSLNDLTPELLQLILSLLARDKYKKYGIPELTHKKFVAQFSRDFPQERCPLILAPLIYSENTEISADKMSANSQGILTSAIMDTSWASLVMEIGKHCRQMIR